MPIIHKSGDLFTTTQKVIAHGVNTKGLMSAGIALKIALKFPKVNWPYIKACLSGKLKPGDAQPVEVKPGFYVMNLATQKYPGSNAKLEYISLSLKNVLEWLHENNHDCLSIPKIGSGIGGLDWEKVEESILQELKKYPNITVEVWTRD